MTPVTAALRRCALAQIRAAEVIASTQGRDIADEMTSAWTSLLSAIEITEREERSTWDGKVFTPSKPKKKAK